MKKSVTGIIRVAVLAIFLTYLRYKYNVDWFCFLLACATPFIWGLTSIVDNQYEQRGT